MVISAAAVPHLLSLLLVLCSKSDGQKICGGDGQEVENV